MFGEEVGYNSLSVCAASDEYNSQVDAAVKQILAKSFERVSKLLMTKDLELRRLSKYLY
jgi:hypothetical protein